MSFRRPHDLKVHFFEGVLALINELHVGAKRYERPDERRVVLLRGTDRNDERVAIRAQVFHEAQRLDTFHERRSDLFYLHRYGTAIELILKPRGLVHTQDGALHDADAVANAVRFIQIMGTEENGPSFAFKLQDEIPDNTGSFGIQARGGLIQE